MVVGRLEKGRNAVVRQLVMLSHMLWLHEGAIDNGLVNAVFNWLALGSAT